MQMCLVCFLLLIQLHVTKGCTLDRDTGLKPVTAHTGGSVLLSCSCKDLQSKPETFTWWKYTNGHGWVMISPEKEKYKDRVEFFNDGSPGNLSLLLSHLTEEDDGDYRCSSKGSRDLRLTVKGCSVNPMSETVTRSVGQSVLLPCFCSELQAKPRTLTWTFNIGPNQRQIFPTVQRNHHTDRVQVFNDLAPGNLSLLLSHLSLQDGGWYRCNLTNRNYRDILLKVEDTPGNSDPQNNINIAIIIIICAAAGVLLMIILGGVMYRKYRGQREIDDGQTGERKQDDVTYSTVVHSNTERAAHTPVTSGDTAVYASIKNN